MNGNGRGGTATPETSTLLERTYALLDESDISLPELFKQTGVPFYWLRKFKQREVKHPSVNRVQRLYEFLSGRRLKV